jgi:hypothetical protein
VQDRIRAETRLVSGPGADAPRFRRRDNFVVTIWPDPNRPGWYTIGHILESRRVKIPRLEYGDHIGREIVLAQNPDQNVRFNPLPGSDEQRLIVANDFTGFQVDRPYEKERRYDLVAVF